MVKSKIVVNGRFLTQRLTGVQRYAYEILRNLMKEGVELIVVVPDEPILDCYDVTGLAIVRVKYFGGQLWEQTSLPLFLYLKRRGSLLLNLCNSAPLFYNRNIVTLHDLAYKENPAWFKKRFVFSYKWAIPRLLKRAIGIVTVSNFSKSEIEKHYPFTKGKIQVVYNAASALISGQANDPNEFLRKNGLSKHEYILSVGSIEPRKNLQTLLKAFEQLNQPNLSLVLVGAKGNVFNTVDIGTGNDRRIKTMGYVSDEQLSILYKNALCFVYPSLYEGFGIPPLEAMKNGCPVIASKIPSLEEVCLDAALFINPLDFADISAKIQLIIEDNNTREKVTLAGLKRSNLFSWGSSALKLNNLLKCLIEKESIKN